LILQRFKLFYLNWEYRGQSTQVSTEHPNQGNGLECW